MAGIERLSEAEEMGLGSSLLIVERKTIVSSDERKTKRVPGDGEASEIEELTSCFLKE